MENEPSLSQCLDFIQLVADMLKNSDLHDIAGGNTYGKDLENCLKVIVRNLNANIK